MIYLIFTLIVIVTIIAAWKPWILSGKEPPKNYKKFSLHLSPPKELPYLDIASILWDNNDCFLVCGENKEKITITR